MKIYYHPETFKGEGEWIVDRIGREFKKYSNHNVNLSLDDVDVWDFNLIWLGASFSWKMLTPNEELLEKIYSVTPVLCTRLLEIAYLPIFWWFHEIIHSLHQFLFSFDLLELSAKNSWLMFLIQHKRVTKALT